MPINGMEKDTEQRLKTERKYVLAALASLGAGVVSSASLFWWGLNHGLNRMVGLNYIDRGIFLVFLLVSAAGGFAGVRGTRKTGRAVKV